jgi:ATP phosphoribosyltransferase regulatory subunit
MSKFEEYDLYVRNKDFLQGNGVITFSDTGGELLALKPDVTLSIIKNTTDDEGCVSKLYYDENVYRISGATHRFKEIMQTGIECIGEVTPYSVYEVLYLAAKSLSLISENFVLDVSHMGIVSAIIGSLTDDKSFFDELTALLSQKNKHEAASLLSSRGYSDESAERLLALISLHGKPSDVLPRLEALCTDETSKAACAELAEILSLFEDGDFADRIRLDFSVINNMSYYNGIVFRGFIDGIPEGVLAGGRYGALMKSMGRRSDAIGFAIYLDLLEELSSAASFDVDVLLLVAKERCTAEVRDAVEKLVMSGRSVSAQTEIPEKLRYRELIRL